MSSTFFPLIELFNHAVAMQIAEAIRYGVYSLDFAIMAKMFGTFSYDFAILAKQFGTVSYDQQITTKIFGSYTKIEE